MYNQILQKYISKNEKVEMSIREHQSKDETEAKKKDDNIRSLIKQEISDNNIKKIKKERSNKLVNRSILKKESNYETPVKTNNTDLISKLSKFSTESPKIHRTRAIVSDNGLTLNPRYTPPKRKAKNVFTITSQAGKGLWKTKRFF